MKLVHVIPISKGIQRDKLSYFSAQDIPDGALVSVPLRNRTVFAIVVNSEEAKDVKAKLKSSDFAMKKSCFKETQNYFFT